MSQGRLFELLCLLLERGRMTAGELAEHFEVSVRTIYRDVDALTRILLPKIQAFFKSEEGQREFAEWKARQEQDKVKQD